MTTPTFIFEKFFVRCYNDIVMMFYTNYIGIHKEVMFSIIPTDEYTIKYKIINEKCKVNLYTSYLFAKNEKDVRKLYLIDKAFDSNFTIELPH